MPSRSRRNLNEYEHQHIDVFTVARKGKGDPLKLNMTAAFRSEDTIKILGLFRAQYFGIGTDDLVARAGR